MLIQFSVANFRSIRDRQTFSMVKAKGAELPDNAFETQAPSKFALLKSAAIYGPNASGKSNFLLAVRAMREIITKPAAGLQQSDKLPIIPFRLTKTTRNQPSEFEMHFIVDKVRYQYGFSATGERIYHEWLLAYPKGRPQHWFEREWDKKTKEYEWYLGSNLIGDKQTWQKATRDKALFLSTAVLLNSKQLRPVYNWFDSTLHTSVNPLLTPLMCQNEDKAKLLEFLRAADLAIEDVDTEKVPFDRMMLPDFIPESLKKEFIDHYGGRDFLKINIYRKDAEGKLQKFDLEQEESDGTRQLFYLAGSWINILSEGKILFIDDLNKELHPYIVQFLIKLFHSRRNNFKNAQLIAITHETSILNQDVLRRDQVWFCEKHKSQATELYPLTDFSPRKGYERLELTYLSGRYGGLPYVKELVRLFDEPEKAAA